MAPIKNEKVHRVKMMGLKETSQKVYYEK